MTELFEVPAAALKRPMRAPEACSPPAPGALTGPGSGSSSGAP